MTAKKKAADEKVRASHTGEWQWEMGQWTITHRSDSEGMFTLSDVAGNETNIPREELTKLCMVGARALSDTLPSSGQRQGPAK